MSRERSEEVMRRYLTEVLIERKLEVIKEIAAEDMWDHTQPKPGREGLERHAGGFLALVPDIQIVINHIVADENTVVGIWTWRGTPVAARSTSPGSWPVAMPSWRRSTPGPATRCSPSAPGGPSSSEATRQESRVGTRLPGSPSPGQSCG